MAKISILVVEDEPLYSDMLQIQIEEMGYDPSVLQTMHSMA